MKFLLSNWFKGIKVLLLLIIHYIFLLIINFSFGKIFLKEPFSAYEILFWFTAGILSKFFYYRLKNFKIILLLLVLILMFFKYHNVFNYLSFAFLCFIFGLWPDSRELEHYELIQKLKKFTPIIVICLLFYKNVGKTSEVLLLAFGFIIVSLIALSLYQLEYFSLQVSKGRWLFTTLIFSLIVGIIFVVLMELIKPYEFLAFIDFIKTTYFSFVELIFKILEPIFKPLDKVIAFLLYFISRYAKIKKQEILPGEPGVSIMPGSHEEYVVPYTVEIIFKVFGLTILLVVFSGIIFLSLKKHIGNFTENDFVDEKESIYTPALFKNSVNELSCKIKSILRSRIKPLIYGDFPAAKIRKMYAQILRAAEKKGYFRKTYETPLEFKAQLKKAFEDDENIIEYITNLYQKARYFPESVLDTEVEEMKKITKTLMQSKFD
ncbi:DUF4129 domain-containing protein [Thermovenabulum gondwanense]|uniref:Protein-glutamine gamma-glutamyltransferase-like C-terminal domain-containing protein n=1 Tax=Thermovenabulum gondwanense TaxID=520767 RepID=A0A161R9V5_9FIRM|nr:DUF4129 domain-containing protein [Thermovenabulum gondwanense]KYO68609.1 hypothetical protein ATZ99_01180 [Thermovenabulum gondwanense]